ncbi:MAG: AsmA family protein [Methylocystaceae bacterium]|nr:AsmA family protein [Methylocystaceae bacterium]
MGRIKLIVGGLAVIVVGLVVAGFAILSSMDFNQYKGEITKQVKAATGRDLTISGDLNLDISLSPKVRVDGVTLSNAAWGSRPEMIKVKSFAAQMKLLPLLFGDIHIVELNLIEPDILLETNKSGKANWEMGTPSTEKKSEEAASSGSSKLPGINSVRIEKAKFIYKDGVKGEETSIVIDSMVAKADDLDDPLNLLFKGSYNGHIISLSGKLGSPTALMTGAPLDVDLTLDAAGTIAKISGKIKDPSQGKGLNLALSAKSDNIAQLAELGGSKVGKVGPFELVATVTDGDNTYKLAGLSVKIGESDLNGDVSVNLGGKVPHIDVNLASKLMNVKDVTPQGDEAAEKKSTSPSAQKDKKGKAAKIFPRDPLPIDGLKAVTANVNYKADKLIVSDFALNDFSKALTLKDGQLTVKPGFTMGGGRFGGTVSMDARKLPIKLDIDLVGKDLGLGASLKETGVTDMIEDGVTQIRFNLQATGESVAGLMSTLSGKTLINVGKGKINSKYINLAGGDLVSELTDALNPFAKKQDFTPLACMVVNLDFNKGVADYSKNIAIQTDKMNVTSSGTIDLADEKLDIDLKPEPRGDAADLGINASSLAGMVRLTGPLSDPGIGIDALGTAKAAMGIGAAIATGGVSLLVSGLADKAMSDSDPCATALGAKSAPKKSPSQPNSTQEKSNNPVDSLKSLFGAGN